jgi:hypothetical protein
MNLRGSFGAGMATLVCVLAAAVSPAETSWTSVLTQQALSAGFPATVPPHVAMVLGLTPKGEGVPFKQLVSRADQQVHTFNVSVAKPREVVIFSVDEKTQKTVVYLLSAAGKLRKAISYQTGGEPHELPATEARTGLAREVRFWSDRAAERAPQPPASPQPVPNPAH